MARASFRVPLESAVERSFLKAVKDLRLPVKVRKMNGLGFAFWPDRLIIGPNRFTMWIEFKRPIVGKLSPGQEDLFKDMGAWGHGVRVFDDGREAALAVKYALMEYGITV